jgi:Uma2 family endonuclease
LIQGELRDRIKQFSGPAGLVLPFVELRCTFAGRSIVPDVVFLLDEHIETDEQGEPVNETPIPPDIHVEIISPDQSVTKSHEKLVHSTANGCPLGWLIDPEKKAINVYRPGQTPERLADDGVLDGGPVLPGFRLPVAEVFGWLRLRRPGAGAGPG